MNRYRIPFYKKRVEQFSSELKEVKVRYNTVSVIRLIVFVLILVSWFYVFTIDKTIGNISGVLMVVIFLVLIKVHKKMHNKREYLKTIIKLNKDEIDSCTGDYSNFHNGDEFKNSNHPYSYDMDIFGEGSLFQYLNRTVTTGGENLLAKWLSDTPLDNETIIKNQKAILELSGLIDFRHKFYTTGKIHKSSEDDTSLIKQWLQLSSFFKYKKVTGIVIWVLPIINVLLLILTIAGYGFGDFLIGLSIVNLLITGAKIGKFNRDYVLLNKSHNNLKKINKLFYLIEDIDVKSPLLVELQNNFHKNNISAGEQINKLTNLLNALDNRNNIILGIVLNALFLWDWNCLWRIEKWKYSHELDYDNWIKSLSYFDALNSLANLQYNNPDFNIPVLSEKNYEYNAIEMGHPLLHNDTRVCNNFNINEKQRYAIITGANMAGKSTFLRTVALNLILAGCGAPVCAKQMNIMPLPLYSSMRAEDSLMKNESYFFAELKRLQRIVKELDKGEKMFIILDEILRGTNSEDKRKGSIEFIKKITLRKAFGLIATHDLELAKLAEYTPDIFKALCFEVDIVNDELKFDYKLTNGITQNMNASFLMKKMDIIDN